MLIAVLGGKGSPGCTTSALAMATFAERETYFLEADSFGGDLAYRYRHAGMPLPESPTVLTVSAAVRHEPADEVLARYSHRLNELLRVVPGRVAAEQATDVDWNALGEALAGTSRSVIIDIGRVHIASPTFPLLARADIVMPVLRASAVSFAQTLNRLDHLVPELAIRRDAAPSIMPVVVAARRHASAVVGELRDLLTQSRVSAVVRDVGWLAYDETAARLLYRGRASGRSRLAASVRDVWPQVLATADLNPQAAALRQSPRGADRADA